MDDVRQSLRRLRAQAILGLIAESIMLVWCMWAVTDMAWGRWVRGGFAGLGILAAALVWQYAKGLRKINVLLRMVALVRESDKGE